MSLSLVAFAEDETNRMTLEEKATERGISVKELEEKKANLQAKAAELGISIDQVRAFIQEKELAFKLRLMKLV